MLDELVKRLRYCSEEHSGCGVCELSDNCVLRAGLLLQAADAIEELIRKIESLESMREITPEAEYAIDKHADNIISHMEELIRGLENKPRWIPVSERPPEEADGMVVVLMPDVFPYNVKQPFVNCKHDCRIQMAYYSEHSGKWYFGDLCANGGNDPIAWIPRNALPQPPKDKS